MKPLIGIPVPTSRDTPYNLRSWPQYAAAVSQAGGDPLQVELPSEEPGSDQRLRAFAGRCAGFVLPGSPADVDPKRYGALKDEATSPADLQREHCDAILLEICEQTRRPLLGVCFGLQSLNVQRGGTLVQDLLPLPVNHGAGPEVAIAHTVDLSVGSLLGEVAQAASQDDADIRQDRTWWRVPVNTSHHQAVSLPGEGLTIVGRSPEDGVAEAVEGKRDGPFLVGVQWHPERSVDVSGFSRALFARLVREAQAWTARGAS